MDTPTLHSHFTWASSTNSTYTSTKSRHVASQPPPAADIFEPAAALSLCDFESALAAS